MADPDRLERRLSYIQDHEPRSAMDEMLKAKIPIHFGGMSDPFMPIEARHEISLRLLHILANYQYPVVVSTKGILAAQEKYLSALKQGRFLVQFSISSLHTKKAECLESGAPSPGSETRSVKGSQSRRDSDRSENPATASW